MLTYYSKGLSYSGAMAKSSSSLSDIVVDGCAILILEVEGRVVTLWIYNRFVEDAVFVDRGTDQGSI